MYAFIPLFNLILRKKIRNVFIVKPSSRFDNFAAICIAAM